MSDKPRIQAMTKPHAVAADAFRVALSTVGTGRLIVVACVTQASETEQTVYDHHDLVWKIKAFPVSAYT